MRKGIAMDTAPAALIELIKEHGRWQEKPVEEEADAPQAVSA